MKAVIDIGSNTFHLLIGKTDGAKPEIVFKKTIAVKLGEGGGISKREIIPVAYYRGLEALKEFKIVIDKYRIEDIKATATAAVRDAVNGADFIEDVYRMTQIKIEIIDGLQEAFYIYRGAKAAGALKNGNYLVMDIGGGSTEFIICNNENILWKDSYRIGAARLLSDFYKSDPLSEKDIQNLYNHFSQTLSSLLLAVKEYQPAELIGTAGSFDSYKDITLCRQRMGEAKSGNNVLYNFDDVRFMELLDEIMFSNHQQRTVMDGLIELRVDMILMASVLCKFILRETGINKITACAYSLKEGVLFGDT